MVTISEIVETKPRKKGSWEKDAIRRLGLEVPKVKGDPPCPDGFPLEGSINPPMPEWMIREAAIHELQLGGGDSGESE